MNYKVNLALKDPLSCLTVAPFEKELVAMGVVVARMVEAVYEVKELRVLNCQMKKGHPIIEMELMVINGKKEIARARFKLLQDEDKRMLPSKTLNLINQLSNWYLSEQLKRR